MDYSPSQLLNSRIYKTKLPTSNELLQPQLCKDVRERLEAKRSLNLKYDKTWDSSKILKSNVAPRSYIVQNSHNNVVRRNMYDIKPSKNKFSTKTDLSNDIVVISAEPIPNNTTSELQSDSHSKVTMSDSQPVEPELSASSPPPHQ
ncbi:unnamed protein product [Psylliodes chrysocephalus]|uniref:Uncharacterized protein n=1 Tax=Psylliodes chrysocephalus TaxID=3402493 RepID=A0A9P0D465_9CUCU|nr:unnamed protein product [Psylliodes chrysocephala]